MSSEEEHDRQVHQAWNRGFSAGKRSAEPRSSWQPIETAPKDGTQITVFVPSHYQGKGGITWAVWINDRWMDAQIRLCEPTLWQPMPALPGGPMDE